MTNQQIMNRMIISMMRRNIEETKVRSAWDRGVNAYALDFIDSLEESLAYNGDSLEGYNYKQMIKALLNGADSWEQYSWGGCSLCYNGQIAERLCTPSELRRTKNGQNRPNGHEEWLDVQTRALYQASARIFDVFHEILKKN